jgi:hypothetical protein
MNHPEVKLKNERFEKSKQLWDGAEEIDSRTILPESERKAYKSKVADFVVPILMEEVAHYKGILEKWMSLWKEQQRLERLIEAEEAFEKLQQQQAELITRMSPQDGSVHEFDDRITSGNGTCFDCDSEDEKQEVTEEPKQESE